MKKVILIILVAFMFSNGFNLFLDVGKGEEERNTFYVDDDYDTGTYGWGADHFNRIQDAIDAANNGDTIKVYSGTYNEHIKIDKSIDLVATDPPESADYTVIFNERFVDNVVSITADQVKLSGFTIESKWDSVTGIFCNSNGSTISFNKISKVRKGIYLTDSSNNSITENTIINCKTNGIYLTGGHRDNIISNNIISNNEHNGLVVYFSERNTIDNNNISGNSEIGLKFVNSNSNTVTRNTIKNNIMYGVYLSNSRGNEIRENDISNNEQGIFLWMTSDIYIAANTITNHKVGINISKYSSNDRISNNNIFSNNNINIAGEYLSITEGEKFQIISIMSYIILFVALIEILGLTILQKKIHNILKTRHPEKYKNLAKSSTRKLSSIRTNWLILLGKLEMGNDDRLKRYVNLFRRIWIISIITFIALILITIFILV